MNLKDAVKSIIKPHEDDVLKPLSTEFSENLDPEHILCEYPRPQMVRDSYINLNGIWRYAITKEDKLPSEFDGEILVPFSPEPLFPAQADSYSRMNISGTKEAFP